MKRVSNIIGILGVIFIIISLFLKVIVLSLDMTHGELLGKDFTSFIICAVVSIIWLILSLKKYYESSIVVLVYSVINIAYILFLIKELSTKSEYIYLKSGFYLMLIGNIFIIISSIINYKLRNKLKLINEGFVEENKKKLSFSCRYVTGFAGFDSETAILINTKESFEFIIKSMDGIKNISLLKSDIKNIEYKQDIKIVDQNYYDYYNSADTFRAAVNTFITSSSIKSDFLKSFSFPLFLLSSLQYANTGNKNKQNLVEFYSVKIITNNGYIYLECYEKPYDFFNAKEEVLNSNKKGLTNIEKPIGEVKRQESKPELVIIKSKKIKPITKLIIVISLLLLMALGYLVYEKAYLTVNNKNIYMSEIVAKCIGKGSVTCDLADYYKKYVSSKIYKPEEIEIKKTEFNYAQKQYILNIVLGYTKQEKIVINVIDDYAPTINCDDNIVLGYDEEFDEKSISIFDYGDGEISLHDNRVTINNNINYDINGDYTIKIEVKDSSNNVSTKTINVKLDATVISMYNYFSNYISKGKIITFNGAKESEELKKYSIIYSFDKDIIVKVKDNSISETYMFNMTKQYMYFNEQYIYFDKDLNYVKLEWPNHQILPGAEDLVKNLLNKVLKVYNALIQSSTKTDMVDLVGMTSDKAKEKYYKVSEIMFE